MYAAVLLLSLMGAAAYAMPSQELKFSPNQPFNSFRLRFDPYEETWAQFKIVHRKDYGDVEEKVRRDIFVKNLEIIQEHNWQYYQKKQTYYLGVNQFTDLTADEYKQYNKLMKQRATNRTIQCTQYMAPLKWQLPDSVDWRKEGYVTPVKNQGQCGSCWSFSTTGSLEGQHFRKSGKLVSLSEQQLVDCSSAFGNQGCEGGLMDQAFEYINSVGGLESESEYPYDASDDRCKFIKRGIITETDPLGCKDIPTQQETMLQKASASEGPISVAIDASHQSFQMYAGGVYEEPKCSSTRLDHGVLVVGYGSENGKEYWIVKNSWSASWGDEGYIKMARNKNNMCGIATSASFPQL